MPRPSLPTALAATGLILSSGCTDKGGDDTGPAATLGDGTLALQLTIGDYDGPGGDKDARTLDLIDVFHTMHSMHVSTGIAEAGTDSLTWVPILEDGTEGYDSELVISSALAAGVYQSVRIEQSNEISWICTDGDEIYAFPMVQLAELRPDHRLIQIFTLDANFVDDGDGNLSSGAPGESMGTSFEVVEGGDTRLTIRTNLDTLDWSDADANGAWSEGDDLDNWTTIPGTTTMVDFIVE